MRIEDEAMALAEQEAGAGVVVDRTLHEAVDRKEAEDVAEIRGLGDLLPDRPCHTIPPGRWLLQRRPAMQRRALPETWTMTMLRPKCVSSAQAPSFTNL